MSSIALIDSRIEELLQRRPNSDETIATIEREIADCEELKRKVEAFLSSASQFSVQKTKEASVVNATTSLAEGIQNWWSKDHVNICDQTFRLGQGVPTK